MFTMRKTRAEPAVTGARIGTPLKITWLPRTRPWNTLGTVFVPGRTAAVADPTPPTVAVPTTVEQPPRPAPREALLQRVCGRDVPTEGETGLDPGSSISNSASEAVVLVLKIRLVTSVLFNDTVMLA